MTWIRGVLSLLALVLAACTSPSSKSDDGAVGRITSQRMYPRVYEVRDLTIRSEPPRDEKLLALIRMIRERSKPGVWDVQGASLQPSSGQIVAVASEDTHREMETILNNLRRELAGGAPVERGVLAPLAGKRVDDPVASASWYLPPFGFMSEVGLDFGKARRPPPPPPDVLQVHILDDLEAGGLKRALSKMLRAEVNVASTGSTDGSMAIRWTIPVHKGATSVRMIVRQTDPKYYNVDLRCDGKSFRLKVPCQAFLLVHGCPTNASLIGLIEFK